ncbi:MAG: LLM class F420-dependent oxidoreductase [bacterium]|nr:LLM class F420-dependent oxidoreductase [bacterium]
MSKGTVAVFGGIFWREQALRSQAKEVAAEIEELGFSGLWLSAGHDQGLPTIFADLLDATASMTIASGIVSIWHATPEESAAAFADLEQRHPGRFLLGIGTSHPTSTSAYNKPYTHTIAYLDGLDAAQTPVPVDRRIVAALGPKMLKLAGERSIGAFPYFVPPEHTAIARGILGRGPLLTPEQAVFLETDPVVARAIARQHMAYYLAQPNYTQSLRQFGFDDADFANGGSDRLADTIVAWGDVDQVADRVRAHHAAGADTVVVQVLTHEANDFASNDYRLLADALM